MFLADAQSFVRAQNIFKYSHYDAELREPAKFIYEYADEYKTLPDVDMVNAKTGAQLQSAADIDPKHFDWFLDEYERFARHKSLETAILASADMLDIKIKGVGGHGAALQGTVDEIIIASHLIQALHTIVSRNINH